MTQSLLLISVLKMTTKGEGFQLGHVHTAGTWQSQKHRGQENISILSIRKTASECRVNVN